MGCPEPSKFCMFFDNDFSSCFIIVLGSSGAEDDGTTVLSRTVLFGEGGGGGGSLWAPREDKAVAHVFFSEPPEMHRVFRCNVAVK